MVKADSSPAADVLAPVGKASAAGLGNVLSADGTFVAGDVYYLDHVGI